MRTCVIGGGGFIGKHLVSLLLGSGRDVVVLGRRRNRPEGLDGRANYVSCDYSEREQLDVALAGCCEIVDLAHATVPGTTFANPVVDLVKNLPASVGLLEAATGLRGLKRIVMVSSGGTVYGPVESLPVDEDFPTRPISPYGIAKLTVEKYALMYQVLKDVPAVIVRPANAYGLGQKPFTGQGFIATAMGCILKRNEVTVFGSEGTIRDYIHVMDIATAILCTIDKGVNGATYNIGSGVGLNNVQILEAIQPLAQLGGYEIRTVFLPARGADVPANVLNSERLRKSTGWSPKVGLTEGLAEMWNDLRAPLDAGFSSS
ncbi:MAG: nucleoside-diphosphate sugar epimerase [Polaromonas sp.]|nr:nucleoside-diphosphate sugar epimerase [Polaromonas sp.]